MGSHGAADPQHTQSLARDGLVLAAACALMTASAFAALPRRAAGEAPLALIFPPWFDGAAAIERSASAGYRVLRTGRLESILIVAAPAAAGETPVPPAEAWFALSLDGLAGCLDRSRDAAGA